MRSRFPRERPHGYWVFINPEVAWGLTCDFAEQIREIFF